MYEYAAKFISNYDGDTCVLSIDLGFDVSICQTIRLVGIDTPELKTGDFKAMGKTVKSWLEGKLTGAKLIIKTSKSDDKYGRILAEIFVQGDDRSVNQQLLDRGWAVPYGGGHKDPDAFSKLTPQR
jgi:endonuclease YncB( thermonuclease family)